MANLTDSQSILLSRAAQRDDGILEDAGSMKPGVAKKVAGALIQKKLMREVRNRPGMPEWRRDQDGRTWSLVITRAGRKTIGVDENDVSSGCMEKGAGSTNGKARETHNPEPGSRRRKEVAKDNSSDNGKRNAGKSAGVSKRSLIISMLSNPTGASIEELVTATGWRQTQQRVAALTRLRQAGFGIERKRGDGKDASTYRITTHPQS